MTSERADQKSVIRMVLALSILGLFLVVILLWGASLALPMFSIWIAETFSTGLGLKVSALISAGISISVILLFAAIAGDGLLGEIQFMTPGFFLFFLFFWLMVAWVF